MSAMPNLTSVLHQLQHERIRLASQLESLNNAISALTGASSRATSRRRRMSAAGRGRIAAAQRARWKKLKGEKALSIVARKGRTMSPAARRKIAAAQKARWAKWRKAQKKG